MFQYHCLNPISQKGLDNFPEQYRQIDSMDGADAVPVPA